MAKVTQIGTDDFVVISRKDAVSIIALLAGQIGSEAPPGCSKGMAPYLVVAREDGSSYRIILSVE